MEDGEKNVKSDETVKWAHFEGFPYMPELDDVVGVFGPFLVTQGKRAQRAYRAITRDGVVRGYLGGEKQLKRYGTIEKWINKVHADRLDSFRGKARRAREELTEAEAVLELLENA